MKPLIVFLFVSVFLPFYHREWEEKVLKEPKKQNWFGNWLVYLHSSNGHCSTGALWESWDATRFHGTGGSSDVINRDINLQRHETNWLNFQRSLRRAKKQGLRTQIRLSGAQQWRYINHWIHTWGHRELPCNPVLWCRIKHDRIMPRKSNTSNSEFDIFVQDCKSSEKLAVKGKKWITGLSGWTNCVRASSKGLVCACVYKHDCGLLSKVTLSQCESCQTRP